MRVRRGASLALLAWLLVWAALLVVRQHRRIPEEQADDELAASHPQSAALARARAPPAAMRLRSRTERLLAELQPPALREGAALGDGAGSELEAAPEHAKQTCYSFNRAYCPPLNLSVQTSAQIAQTFSYCQQFARLEDHTPLGFCGRRLPRRNPCWRERGATSCLPHFFMLGEMKCGTTSLYQLLDRHPHVVPPLTKEPRFLMPARYRTTTLSRYAINFKPVISRVDSVTFDASPVYLRSPLARDWIKRWLPHAKLIALVRDPVQRAYSHWKMGTEWLSSKCTRREEVEQLRPWQAHLAFGAMMERGLLQHHFRACARELGQASVAVPRGLALIELPHRPAAAGGNDSAVFDGELGRCILSKDPSLAIKFRSELAGQAPRHKVDSLRAVERLVMRCSESMLTPESALAKGLAYSKELRAWAELFPRSQLLVIHTDDLASSAQRIMNATFSFLGLTPVDVGTQSRFCVHGKAGVMDVLQEDDNEIDIRGQTPHTGDEPPNPKAYRRLHVGPCGEDEAGMLKTSSGALHHKIDAELQQRLRALFKPSNEDLYAFLGRDLGW
ncbi:hypothetical protein AB1Y20_013260 [Prymnesium parvum]|uniref:Sulfotransferase domain-containing protein n=1 Tax=Prymnesium parvum TaxID=97485 RepID=A0AB34INP8_PRYPA